MDRGRPYVERMLEAVRAVPGVEALGAVSGGLPLSGGRVTMAAAVPGRPPLAGDDAEIDTRVVTPEYLQIMRVPLFRGRHLAAEDREGAPPALIVNETAARAYWPGLDPIEQRLHVEDKERTVVGSVGDIRHDGPEVAPHREAYSPLAQQKVIQAALVMRTTGGPAALLPAVKAAIWSVNPDQVLYTDRVTLDSYMDGLIAQRRFNMALLALFGVLGLVISAVGVYGVMAYVVSQRTKEIGVRMALGNAGLLVAMGLTIGGVAAWNLGAVANAFLFQLDGRDPRVFAGAIVCLACTALLACVIPALRAAAVNPMIALRAE